MVAWCDVVFSRAQETNVGRYARARRKGRLGGRVACVSASTPAGAAHGAGLRGGGRPVLEVMCGGFEG